MASVTHKQVLCHHFFSFSLFSVLLRRCHAGSSTSSCSPGPLLPIINQCDIKTKPACMSGYNNYFLYFTSSATAFHEFSFALLSLKDFELTSHRHGNFFTASISFSGKSSLISTHPCTCFSIQRAPIPWKQGVVSCRDVARCR